MTIPMRETMRANAAKRLRAITLRMFSAKPPLTSSQYADRFGVLVEGDKVRPWKTYDYQRPILDDMGDVTIGELVIMKCARVGISECLNQEIQRRIHWDPCAIGMYRPTDKEAESWVDVRFEPRVKAIPELRELVSLTAAGKRKEIKTERMFKNGASLMVMGADSEDNFRDKTLKFIPLDECDAVSFRPTKGGGNKYDMARRRGYQYWDSKVVAISTPKFPADEGGLIHSLFLESDQRYLHVQCPHCGYDFVPEWGDQDSIGGMKWDPEDPTKVWYQCHNPDLEEHERCKIQEHEKHAMISAGTWVPHRPEVKKRRGYHIWQWYAKTPKASWENLVAEWLEACATGAAQIQSFKNEVLGLPYSTVSGSQTSDFETLARCVTDLGVPGAEVPEWAAGLFWGVDRQKGGPSEADSYLEASLWAFGPGRRPFMVGHWVLDAYPQSDPRCWDELEALATRTFTDTAGRPRKADGLAIDHNGGYTQKMMEWLLRMRRIPGRKYWVAVRGESAGNGNRTKHAWPDSHSKKQPALHTIDVDLIKDEIHPILADGALEFNANPIEGSVNLSNPEEAETFFKRMLLEKRYPVPNRPGAFKWYAPKGLGRKGNEPFDGFVYAYGLSIGVTKMPGADRLRFRRAFEHGRTTRIPTHQAPQEAVEEVDVEEVVAAPAPTPEPGRIRVPVNPNAVPRPRTSPPPRPGLIHVGRF